MRRNILSLSLLTILMSSLIIFQNCGKSGRQQALTAADQINASLKTSSLNTSQTGTTPEQQAADLYKRLAGLTLSPSDSVYNDMVGYIQSGHREKAAELATRSKSFYTITVRDFANKMSIREENTLAPLSDFVATVIGAVRDDVSATELLTGNFYYRVRGVSGVSDNVLNDIVSSNKHYDQIESTGVDLVEKLEREEGQKMRSPSGAVVTHDDAAGLLTTRAFMLAHANAGTNRRMIEYTFKIFQCTPVNGWASTTNPDSHVGRDIGRYPIEEYNNKCKGCHTGMDGMRPATAYYDFFMQNETTKDGYVKYRYTYTTDIDADDSTKSTAVPNDQQLVSTKFRRGSSAFPDGYVVKSNQWINYADDGVFGWNTPTSGEGMSELGQMIAYSDGFRRCMVQRVFSSVCKYDLTSADKGLINKLASDFKYNGYNLKELFIDVALRPECLGVEN